jgi:hypothetical protein
MERGGSIDPGYDKPRSTAGFAQELRLSVSVLSIAGGQQTRAALRLARARARRSAASLLRATARARLVVARRSRARSALMRAWKRRIVERAATQRADGLEGEGAEGAGGVDGAGAAGGAGAVGGVAGGVVPGGTGAGVGGMGAGAGPVGGGPRAAAGSGGGGGGCALGGPGCTPPLAAATFRPGSGVVAQMSDGVVLGYQPEVPTALRARTRKHAFVPGAKPVHVNGDEVTPRGVPPLSSRSNPVWLVELVAHSTLTLLSLSGLTQSVVGIDGTPVALTWNV